MIARAGRALGRAARAFWWWLRRVSGDAAYDDWRARHGGDCACTPLSRREFHRRRLARRYAGISRCC